VQTTQALAVLAQVSVAFAGFSAIVTAFGKRTPEQWRPLDRLRFRFMVEFSLFTLCLSLAPLFVLAFGIAEAAVWRSCSALLALGALFYMLLSAHRVRRLTLGGVPMSRGFVALNFAVGAAIALSSILNALGVFSQSAAVYLADVGGCFFVCAEMFARLLLSGSPSHLLSSPGEPDEANGAPGGPARP
jgi:hypothetical protein